MGTPTLSGAGWAMKRSPRRSVNLLKAGLFSLRLLATTLRPSVMGLGGSFFGSASPSRCRGGGARRDSNGLPPAESTWSAARSASRSHGSPGVLTASLGCSPWVFLRCSSGSGTAGAGRMGVARVCVDMAASAAPQLGVEMGDGGGAGAQPQARQGVELGDQRVAGATLVQHALQPDLEFHLVAGNALDTHLVEQPDAVERGVLLRGCGGGEIAQQRGKAVRYLEGTRCLVVDVPHVQKVAREALGVDRQFLARCRRMRLAALHGPVAQIVPGMGAFVLEGHLRELRTDLDQRVRPELDVDADFMRRGAAGAEGGVTIFRATDLCVQVAVEVHVGVG